MLSTDSLMGALDPGTCGEPEQEVGDVSDMRSPESRTLSVFFPPHNLGPGLHGPFPCNTVPGGMRGGSRPSHPTVSRRAGGSLRGDARGIGSACGTDPPPMTR